MQEIHDMRGKLVRVCVCVCVCLDGVLSCVVHSSNIKIVRELEQVFEPYRILFKELTGKEKETKKAAFITMFLQRKENKKKKKKKKN
jgi:hypothetical protein